MRTTRVVFILISILIFAPVIFLQGRTIFRKWKEKQTRQALLRLGAAVVLCLAFGIYYFVIPVYSWVSGSVGGGKDSDNFHRETGTEYGYNSIYADIAG